MRPPQARERATVGNKRRMVSGSPPPDPLRGSSEGTSRRGRSPEHCRRRPRGDPRLGRQQRLAGMGEVPAPRAAGQERRAERAEQIGEGEQRAKGEARPRVPGACAGRGRGFGGTRRCADRRRRGRCRAGDGGRPSCVRHVEDSPAGVPEALAEVGLVGVDEEVGVEPADLLRRLAANQHRARLRPADRAGPIAAALHGQPAVQKERSGERRSQPPAAARRRAGACRRAPAAGRRRRRPPGRPPSPPAAPRGRPAAARCPRSGAGSSGRAPPAAGWCRSRPCRRAGRARSALTDRPRARTASTESSSEALSSTSTSLSSPPGAVRSIASRQASSRSRPPVLTTQ